MGIWERIGRLLGRRERTPLEKARQAAKVLRRKGYDNRRRRPPRPDESAEGGNAINYGFASDSSGGGGGGGD